MRIRLRVGPLGCNVVFSSVGLKLREQGLDDLAIAGLIQAAAFFNWANRLMLSIGEPTPATA